MNSWTVTLDLGDDFDQEAFRKSAPLLIAKLSSSEHLEDALPEVQKLVKMLPPSFEEFSSKLPSQAVIEGNIGKFAKLFSWNIPFVSKKPVLSMLGMSSDDLASMLPFSQPTPEMIREGYPCELFLHDKQLLEREGVEAVVADKLRVHARLRDVSPQLADLVAASFCPATAPDDYAGALRGYYADVFPHQTYDEAVVTLCEAAQCGAYDVAQKLGRESIDGLTVKDFGMLLSSVLADVPPVTLAATVHHVAETAEKTRAFLASSEDDVVTLPEEIVRDINTCREQVTVLYAAVGKAVTASRLPLVTRFDEVIEKTRENRRAAEGVTCVRPPTSALRSRSEKKGFEA